MSKTIEEYRRDAVRLLAGITSGVGAPTEVASRRADSLHSFRNLLGQMRAANIDPTQVFNQDFRTLAGQNPALKAFIEGLPKDALKPDGTIDLSRIAEPAAHAFNTAMEQMYREFPQMKIGVEVPSTSGRFPGGTIHTTLAGAPETTRAAVTDFYNRLPAALRLLSDPNSSPTAVANVQRFVTEKMAEMQRLGVSPGDVLRAGLHHPGISAADRPAIDRMLAEHNNFTRTQAADIDRSMTTGIPTPIRVAPFPLTPAGRLGALLDSVHKATGVGINLDPQSPIGDFSIHGATPIKVERHGAVDVPRSFALPTGFERPEGLRLTALPDDAVIDPAAGRGVVADARKATDRADNGRNGVG